MSRGLAIAVLPLVLGGCLPVFPPAIQLATTGFSGIAYLATGKSTTDHLISAVVDEDCSVARVALGDGPCREYDVDNEKPLTEIVTYYPGDHDNGVDFDAVPQGEVSGSSILTARRLENPRSLSDRDLQSWPPGAWSPENWSSGTDQEADTHRQEGGTEIVAYRGVEDTAPVRLEGFPDLENLPVTHRVDWKAVPESTTPETKAPENTGNAEPEKVSVVPMPKPWKTARAGYAATHATESGLTVPPPMHFVMVGSFRESRNAEILRDTFQERQAFALPVPVIMTVEVNGGLWHRVALGPFKGLAAASKVASALDPVYGKAPWVAPVFN